MSNSNEKPKSRNSSDRSEEAHNDFHDFHPSHRTSSQDDRPVNLDGRPEHDFDTDDDSLFRHTRRY